MNSADSFCQIGPRVPRILVVEDDLLFLSFYELFLETKGCEFTGCASLADANACLDGDHLDFDVAILDNQLADGQGLSLADRLQNQLPYCAILMASATDDADFFLQAFDAGISDYIIKPVNMELLWQKIQAMIQRFSLERLAQQQSQALSHWKAQEEQQQLLAHHLFDVMLNKLNAPHPAVLACVRPSSTFSGDCILQCLGPDGSLYLFFADATGHGLAAAVSLMPMLQLFPEMAAKAMPLSNIVFELNRRLNELLPDDRFVASVLMRISVHEQRVEIWNGCMPDVLLLDDEQRIVHRARSTNMALGILDKQDAEVMPQVFACQGVTQLLMYSDGLTETPQANGDVLSTADVLQLVQTYPQADDLLQHLDQLLPNPDDDISLCLVHYTQLAKSFHLAPFPDPAKQQLGQLRCELQLSGQLLATTDVPDQIAHLLSQQNLPIALVQRVFTIVAELYSNAFEHGVLRMDSQLKNDEDGFIQYYELKEQRLQRLCPSDDISLSMLWDSQRQELQLTIVDSGPGFAAAAHQADDQDHHGRGLALIRKLSSSFALLPPGNQCRITLNLEANDD